MLYKSIFINIALKALKVNIINPSNLVIENGFQLYILARGVVQ